MLNFIVPGRVELALCIGLGVGGWCEDGNVDSVLEIFCLVSCVMVLSMMSVSVYCVYAMLFLLIDSTVSFMSFGVMVVIGSSVVGGVVVLSCLIFCEICLVVIHLSHRFILGSLENRYVLVFILVLACCYVVVFMTQGKCLRKIGCCKLILFCSYLQLDL